VNFIVFFIFNNLLNIEETISNVIAWIFSVLFAYFSCRILWLVITDIGIFILLVKIFKINVYIVKIFNQVLVTILNYVFSKLIVFKKKDKNI